jgi:predicted flap endonuclease-1-like 5' DNA nuclease
MIYLLQALSGWWIAALVLGLLFGLFIAGAIRPGLWSALAAVLYILGAVAVMLQWPPDRYGFWLETALLVLTFYLVGLLVGMAFGRILRRLFGGRKAPAVAAAPVLETEASAGKEASAWQDVLAGEGVALDAAVSETPPASITRLEPAADEDDLLRIRGMDENAVQVLRDLGVHSFPQLAALTPEQERLFTERRPDYGPVARQLLIAQARLIDGGVHPNLLPPDNGISAQMDEGRAHFLRAALPEIATPHAHDALYAGVRPLSLLQPPLGEMDDLEKIDGIDAATAERLNALGIWTYTQIACWSNQNIRWIGSYLAFPGRIEREAWVSQAQALVT